MFRKRLVVLAVALVSTMALLAGCASSGSKAGTVTVGSKDFTESIVLGELLAQLIENNTDLKVERKLNLGGTKVNFDGIKAGQLDMYVDYDGTAWGAHLGNTDPVADPSTLFDVVNKDLAEQFKIRFTAPFGFNNTYALAMPRAIAEEHNIKTYTDLAAHADKFVFGTTSEFMGRDVDGFNPLSDAYGFKFKDVKSMTAGLRYKAVEQDEIQVMDAYATDGNLKEFDMVILEDDKQFFPPYYGAPLVRIATMEKYPDLEPLLNKLGNTMNDEVMQELNYRVAVEEEAVEAVVSDWLKSVNLIK